MIRIVQTLHTTKPERSLYRYLYCSLRKRERIGYSAGLYILSVYCIYPTPILHSIQKTPKQGRQHSYLAAVSDEQKRYFGNILYFLRCLALLSRYEILHTKELLWVCPHLLDLPACCLS
jgi:hypothetical protein